ncbi:MAG: hypothetical protein LBV72_10020 [Tannerella sp.]|jgi:hypothetical protein|nr:hypothetical protein [Tannerella sp.]
MEITSDKRRISAQSEVGTFTIKYDCDASSDGEVSNVNARIYKGDEIIGSANANQDGILGFSLHKENKISGYQLKRLFNKLIEDIKTILKPI